MRIPDYPHGTLADVLSGCLHALGVSGLRDPLGLAESLGGVRRVAVLLVDGMGWHQLPAMPAGVRGLPGRAITCGFPSTTPTSLVSLATGALPGAHGVLAFTTRVPGTDRILNHTVWTDDPVPGEWQPVAPLYVRAVAQGLEVTVVSRPEYVGSGLTVVTTRGARYEPTAGSDLAEIMLRELKRSNIVYGYTPELDKAGHAYGLTSPEWDEAASDVDSVIARLAEDLPADAALVVTADHGQLDVPADRRIDIDSEPLLAEGVALFAGEPRVRYLHAVPGAEADVLAAWRERAGHTAWIGTREEAIATGWYGPFSPSFAQRIGDVVVVCQDDWAVLGTRRERASIAELVAMHGALTEAEMTIPLLVVRGG
jgi:Type I phosphodiesterase / nucleotide pyrophosphatase